MSPSIRDDPEHGTSDNDQSPWGYDEGPEPSASETSDLHIQSDSSDSGREDGQLPVPVWLRESSKSFHWRRVPLRVRKAVRLTVAWTKGPDPPQLQRITPFFPTIQEAPAWLIDRYLPGRRHKVVLLALFYFSWFLTFTLVLNHSATTGYVKGYGKPASIWCGASYWSPGNQCGLNGNRCRPFGNSSLAFRCPANCANVKVLNPRAVGDQEINYRPFVVGGPANDEDDSAISEAVYRGDSFLCQAAIHAGIMDNEGGCGVVSLAGEHSNFPGASRNGIQSISFDSSFPQSFKFIPSNTPADCITDLRWPLLAVTVTFTTLLSVSTTSPAIFFPSIFTMLFLHVGLVSDPPNLSSLPSLTSLVVERFLPAAFVAYVIYRYCVSPQLTGLNAHFEKTILWLGGAWVGALNNYTFDFIPIQRLTPHDLRAQPSAQLALVIIVVIIFAIALGQIWYLRLEGRLRRYLAIYALFGLFLLICVAIPSLNLRIHHYVLALLLLPGTRTQTRPSLLYQGILVGLFINGIARWGFDSILQTADTLRGDGQLDSLLPNITIPFIGLSNITFGWMTPPQPYDGISVLVNDVERYRWYEGEGESGYTFEKKGDAVEKAYFRFGYMSGSETGDYTKAGVWNGDGDGGWREMEPGPS